MKKCFIAVVILIFFTNNSYSQNTRITNKNTIGWYNYFGTFKLNNKWGLHTEYQWRRENLITNWQQGLLRVGVNYQLNPKVQLRLGFAWIETFAYGDITINAMGKNFTERRLFEMATLTDKVGIVDLSHRLMLEQRWAGRYTNASLQKEDAVSFLNRIRYMFRCQVPLNGKEIKNSTAYLAMYDEIFVGSGKNVNENIFDQNRFGVLVGYKFNPKVRIELGYLNQIIQLGREVNNSNVFQYNSGIILNTNFNFDLSKKQ